MFCGNSAPNTVANYYAKFGQDVFISLFTSVVYVSQVQEGFEIFVTDKFV